MKKPYEVLVGNAKWAAWVGAVGPGVVAAGRESDGITTYNVSVCRAHFRDGQGQDHGVHPGKLAGSSCYIPWGQHEYAMAPFDVLYEQAAIPPAPPTITGPRDIITFTAGSTVNGVNVTFTIANGVNGKQVARILGANVSPLTCAIQVAEAAQQVGLRSTWSGNTVTIGHEASPYKLTTTGGCTMAMQTINH